MTLILTAVCPHFIVQMSDRLVVALRGGPYEAHDPTANKVVVYRAADALVTIGFSGIAYVGLLPTDEWIAQTLHGETLRAPGDDRPSKKFGGPGKPLKIGQAVKRLRDAIAALPAGWIDEHGLFLELAGWQAERGGSRPIIEEISRIQGKTTVKRAPRIWRSDQNFRINSIGATPPAGALEAALAPHRKSADNPRQQQGSLQPKPIEEILASVIRQASAANATVGSHLLSVVLMRPDRGIAGCRFLPLTPHGVEIISASGERQILAAAHTPWILGPGFAFPPSLEIGHSILDLGGLEFHIFGAEPPGNGIQALSSSLRRPGPPRR